MGDIELLSVERIWDEAPHNAFTDLVRWRDSWWCTFREGENHVSDEGALRMRQALTQALQDTATPQRDPREIMTMEEVAEFLRTTADEVDRRLADVPCFELGGNILFRRDAVLEWVDRQERSFAADLIASDLRYDDPVTPFGVPVYNQAEAHESRVPGQAATGTTKGV